MRLNLPAGAPVFGTTAFPTADQALLKAAGMTALRIGLPWPWEDRVGGKVSARWKSELKRFRALAGDGFTLIGNTPIIGTENRVRDAGGKLITKWNPRTPQWMGDAGTEAFTANYAACCQFYGENLRGIVPMYQILNELDISIFAGPLNLRQSSDLITAAARALRSADPGACLGINTAKSARSYYLYGRLYVDDLLDYCGVDGYLGTWEKGVPGDWAGIIRELHAITARPVFVNEWGFSSAGGTMTDEEAKDDPWPCQLKKWRYSWGGGHTAEAQAAYVREAMQAFRSCGDTFLGCLFYRWEDQEKCWHCGEPDCPAETAWGLVTRDGKPKPSFHAFREGVEAFREKSPTLARP